MQDACHVTIAARRWAAGLLLVAVAFNLVTLLPEVTEPTPTLNDNVLHVALVKRTVDALELGEDPTDPWVPYVAQGYPLFHHYQHLPHVVTALLSKALGGAVSPERVLAGLAYLLLSTFPLSIYWTGRRLGAGALPSALAGVVASLLSTDGLYGFGMGSYVWRGYGLYTQLWGMWLLGPAVGHLTVTLREGRAYAATTALLAATLLSHTVCGYVALLSGGLLVLVEGAAGLRWRIGRLALTLLLVAIVASYFLVPFLLDRDVMNRSVWEDPGKYDAYGWEWTLRALVQGELLDAGRFPSLTLLAGLGLIVCLAHWRRSHRHRALVAFFGFWLLLAFGRPTWGALLNLLPMGQYLHLHRLIAPVHLGAIGLIGVGLAWLWKQAQAGRRVWLLAAAGLVTAGLLAPVYVERVRYLRTNARWMRQTRAAFEADGGAMQALLTDLAQRPPGRVYAGRSVGWGRDYTIGHVPVYALLTANQVSNPGHLYHALSLNADVEGYLDEGRPATFNLFNLRYVLAPEGQPVPDFAQPLVSYGDHQLYEVETTGTFDLVDSDLTLYGDRSDWFEAASAWVQSDLVEARQHPRIALGPAPAGEMAALSLSAAPAAMADLGLPRREPCGRVLAEEMEGSAYAVTFEAERPCWLMMKQTYHPGWRATLDGRATDVEMLAPSFVGLPVEAGRHRATLTYRLGALRRVLMIVGLVTLSLTAIVEWQRERVRGLIEGLARSRIVPGRATLDPLRREAPRGLAIGGVHRRLARARESLEPHLPFLGGVLLITLLAGLPLLQLKVMRGHDALEYLPRTIEFYHSLEEGHLLPRWAPHLSRGYGQPSFIFNPPLIYWAASLFHALGASVIASLDLACPALLVVAGLGTYAFAQELLGRAGGLAAAAAYVLAPFMLVNLYVRHAFADYAAMAFIPWAFWGLRGWVGARSSSRGGAYRLPAAAAAIALVLLSSNPVALITVPALLLYVAFLAWRARSGQVLLRGGWAIALGLGLAAFFWVPALMERGWVQTERLLEGYLSYRNHFVYLHQLVHSPWGYGFSVQGADDGMSFGLGPIHLGLLAISLFLVWRRRHRPAREKGGRRDHLLFLVGLLGVVALLVTNNSIWLWDALPVLQYLEFPWRILALAAVATAFACGFPLSLAPPAARRWLLAAVLIALVVTGVPRARPEGFHDVSDADYAPHVIAQTGIAVTTAGEYEPIWAEAPPQAPAPAGRLLVLNGEVRVLESRVTDTRYEWLLEAAGPARLRVATFYYPGWRLSVDGERRPVVQNGQGTMDVALEAGTHRVTVAFGTTPLRSWASWAPVAALLLLVLSLILVC